MNLSRCPKLFLAPMEGVGTVAFRKALATIGGFDEACTEFLRVPNNAHVPSLAKKYNPKDTDPIPQAVQIMGSIPELMGEMTKTLIKRGAHRVDLNCGCPSNTVTGKGAGSSLLKTPLLLCQITQAMSSSAKSLSPAYSAIVTVKLRSGYEDTSLFEENLLAAQEGGASFITLHPRTKRDGYKPPADWALIARAKQLLKIPVVGNGDIRSPADAVRMIKETQCDALMIGRGAVIDPWIFHKIKAHFSYPYTPENWEDTENYIRTYFSLLDTSIERNRINQLKQLASFLFQASLQLEECRLELLKSQTATAPEFLEKLIEAYRLGSHFNNHLDKRKPEERHTAAQNRI